MPINTKLPGALGHAIRSRIKHVPLEERTGNELPSWLLKLLGCTMEEPKETSLEAWRRATK